MVVTLESVFCFAWRMRPASCCCLATGSRGSIPQPAFLANLTEIEYASIGLFARQVLDERHQDFQKSIVL